MLHTNQPADPGEGFANQPAGQMLQSCCMSCVERIRGVACLSMLHERISGVETPRMEKLSVNLPAEAVHHVQQRAWATFTDMSGYIRQLVFEDMERHSEPTGPRAA